MKKKIIFIIVCILFPLIAEGAEWARIDTETDDKADKFYFDIKSIVHERTAVTLWVKSVSSSYDSKSRFTINCQTREFKITDTVRYDKNGRVLKSTQPDENPAWHGIPPETRIDNLRDMVCEDDKPRILNDTVIEYMKGFREWAIKESQKKKAKTND